MSQFYSCPFSKLWLLFIAFVPFSLLTECQGGDQDAAGTPQKNKPVYAIEFKGQVVDSDGNPVAKAMVIFPSSVELFGVQRRTLIEETDEQGQYRFTLPIADRREMKDRHVWAWAKGHGIGIANYVEYYDDQGKLTELSKQPPIKPITIKLPKIVPRDFEVITKQGKPLVGGKVTPFAVRVPNGANPTYGLHSLLRNLPVELLEITTTITDANGRVVLDQFRPSLIDSVRVVSESHGTQYTHPEVYLKDRLRLGAVGSVSGRIEGPADMVGGVKVNLTTYDDDRRPLGSALVTTNAEGIFHVPAIAAGTLQTSINLDPKLRWRVTGAENAKVEANGETAVKIFLKEGIPFVGRLVAKGSGKPIAEVLVSIGDDHVWTDQNGELHGFVIPGNQISVELIDVDAHTELEDPEILTVMVPLDATSFRCPDIELASAKIGSGRLIDQNNKPVVGKYVAPFLGEKQVGMYLISDENGRFLYKISEDNNPDQWRILTRRASNETIPTKFVSKEPLVLQAGTQ